MILRIPKLIEIFCLMSHLLFLGMIRLSAYHLNMALEIQLMMVISHVSNSLKAMEVAMVRIALAPSLY